MTPEEPQALAAQFALMDAARIDTKRPRAGRRLGRVDVHESVKEAEEAWSLLEDSCPGTSYQTRGFLLPWLATFGAAAGVTPMIVTAYNSKGAPVALLPFGIVKSGPARIAGFLGGADSNANMGLFSPDFSMGAADLESLLRAAAAKSRLKPDLFLLRNQPESWEGQKNPLDIFPHQASASFCHGGELASDPQSFMRAHLSKDALKKLRQKRARLEGMGEVSHIVASTPRDVAKILDAFFAQKLERFRQKNIASNFSEPASRSFLERACHQGLERGAAAIELHALTLGGAIVAAYGAGLHRGHLHLMFNSFDPDREIAKASPGDLLAQMILERACRNGLKSFDFGIGEARYKDAWCDRAEPMFDSVLAISAAGHAFRLAESARLNAKRWIKQSKWAWPLAQTLMRRG